MKEQDNYNIEKNEENEVDLRELLDLVLSKWYWFAGTVAACLALAYLYLSMTAPVYNRTAVVLIKDENKGGPLAAMSSFMELGGGLGGSNVDNEIHVFQSKRLIQNMVARLGINVDYSIKHGLRSVDLYGKSPIEVIPMNANSSLRATFVIKPISELQYELNEVELPKETLGSKETSGFAKTVNFNDTVSTPMGVLIVKKSRWFDEAMVGNAIKVNLRSVSSAAMAYMKELTVAPASKGSSLIRLSINDTSVQRAEDVLNTLIAVYNEDAINDKNQITQNTSKFIDERLLIISQELGDVDQDIERFKRKNRLTDIASEAGVAVETRTKYKAEYVEVENQLSVVNFVRAYLTDPNKARELIPANTGVSDVAVESQIAKYNEMLLKRDKLSYSASEQNPVLVDLNQSLEAMRRSIVHSIDNLLASLEIKRSSLLQEEDRATTRIESVPSQEKYVLTVARQQKIKEELYLFLLNKREESALSLAITESNARIVDDAYGTNVPVAPKRAMVFLVALLAGCALPAGLLFVLQALNTTVQGRKDIEKYTSIPYLGEIPKREQVPGEDEVVVTEHGRDEVSEAFRIMRSNIAFMSVQGKPMQTVMLTSANPGSGKTFVSLNLAMSIAQTTKRVILVDTDIRKGTLSKQIQTDSMKGLTHYLSGRVEDINEIVSKAEQHPNLDVIHAGPVPPNPAELLLSERLDTLIGELRKNYDYIIIDNVPAMVVADATIVNRVADMTIYVVREGMLDKRMLPSVERLYQEKRLTNMSIVLNGARLDKKRYGYGYGYGYEKDKKKPFLKRWFS